MSLSNTHILRMADLNGRSDYTFKIEPETAARMALGDELGLRALKKLRFEGRLTPQGKTDWQLTARLGATVVQDCVVTLEPVTTRIDEQIVRTYVKHLDEPQMGEVEMPEDDSVEVLPVTLDLTEVMAEALSLALPAFPRATDAELGQAVFTEPGQEPMTDQDARPFAALAALKKANDDGNAN